jgi:hypothetical protein
MDLENEDDDNLCFLQEFGWWSFSIPIRSRERSSMQEWERKMWQ